MSVPDQFATLVAAIRAELAALEAEDAQAIEAATRAKTEAMAAVQAEVSAGRIDRPALELARSLNAEAALKARAKMLGVERRLRSLTGLDAAPPTLTYGRDGRWARAG